MEISSLPWTLEMRHAFLESLITRLFTCGEEGKPFRFHFLWLDIKEKSQKSCNYSLNVHQTTFEGDPAFTLSWTLCLLFLHIQEKSHRHAVCSNLELFYSKLSWVLMAIWWSFTHLWAPLPANEMEIFLRNATVSIRISLLIPAQSQLLFLNRHYFLVHRENENIKYEHYQTPSPPISQSVSVIYFPSHGGRSLLHVPAYCILTPTISYQDLLCQSLTFFSSSQLLPLG